MRNAIRACSLLGALLVCGGASAQEQDWDAVALTIHHVAGGVYYLEGQGWSEYKGKIQWEIPEDSYFMLGDNNGSSRDSRLWTITRATLKDGRIIEWDTSDDEEVSNYHGSHPSDDRLVVVEEDVAGTYHEFWGRDVQDWEAVVGSPFVPRSNLIGRALAVFWPIHIPRVYPGPSRIKLIR